MSEFVTVTTYQDAIVPEWIITATGDFGSTAIRRAFREGVEAANNVLVSNLPEPTETLPAPLLVPGEPSRALKYRDDDGDLWSYSQVDGWGYSSDGTVGFYAYGSWSAVTSAFPGIADHFDSYEG